MAADCQRHPGGRGRVIVPSHGAGAASSDLCPAAAPRLQQPPGTPRFGRGSGRCTATPKPHPAEPGDESNPGGHPAGLHRHPRHPEQSHQPGQGWASRRGGGHRDREQLKPRIPHSQSRPAHGTEGLGGGRCLPGPAGCSAGAAGPHRAPHPNPAPQPNPALDPRTPHSIPTTGGRARPSPAAPHPPGGSGGIRTITVTATATASPTTASPAAPGPALSQLRG